ncbi:hypothetical protein [Cytobacillus firmus]|uniref:GAP1-N2 domain-containing protein n=1 Tax=Cytobacillus firmus TaxID=1399 RepID=UPI002495616F|nr:hypothetical protein [Cytobacillus firmus]
MSFLHHYYTSAKTGINGGQGFQIYSMSPGIHDQELEEIERLGMYNPPNQLPQSADENSFPKSFYFSELRSGRYVMGLSQYAGKDYSGRYGNYFCHTVVFDREVLTGYPIDYFESQDFKNKLTQAEEESTERPENLQATKHFLKGSMVNKTSVVQFINQKNRPEMLKKLISAVLLYPETRQRAVIVDHDENMPFWIAAVQYVFPLSFSVGLTFATYTNDPVRSNAMICGVYHEEMPPSYWNQQFYVFDCIRESFSPVEGSSYAETVVPLLLSDSDKLASFLAFIEKTGLKSAGPALNELISLYQLTVNGPSSINAVELKQAISVAASLEDINGLIYITDLLFESWGRDPDELSGFVLDVPADSMESIADWWFKIAHSTKKEKHMEFAASFFFQSWAQLLIDDRDNENHRLITAYYERIMLMNKDHKVFSRMGIDPARLNEIYSYCKTETNAQRLHVFLSDFIKHAQRLKLDWEGLEQQRSYLLQMTNLAIEHKLNLPAIIETISEREEAFIQTVSRLLKHYRDTGKTENEQYLLDALLNSIETGKSDVQPLLHMIRKNSFLKETIFQLLSERIRTSRTPIQKLLVLHKKIMSQSPELDQLTNDLLKEAEKQMAVLASAHELLKEAETLWTNETLLSYLSPADRIRQMEKLEKMLPFSEDAKQYKQLIIQLDMQKEKIIKSGKPSISKALRLLLEMDHGKEPSGEALYTLQNQLVSVSSSQYESLLSWKFPAFMESAHKKEQQLVGIFTSLLCYEHEDLFFNTLNSHFSRSGKNEKVKALAAFCCSVVHHNTKLGEKQIQFFEGNKAILRKVREEAVKLPRGKETDAYLLSLQTRMGDDQEASIFGKMKSLLKIGKHEG